MERPCAARPRRRLARLSSQVLAGAGAAPAPAAHAPGAPAPARGLAVVTGASRGIGRAVAEAFVLGGWRVLALSRSGDVPPGVVHRPTDLLEPGWAPSLEAWLRDSPLVAGEGPCRICLVHNAAVHLKDSAVAIGLAGLQRSFELNVLVPAALNKLLFPRMGPGSSILYIGSTLSEKAVKNTASYVTTKHALAGLMKCTCQDLAGTQVHTALLCPGFTATEMLLDHVGRDPEAEALVLSMQTMGRLIEPKEIAAAVRFCAENPVVNGSVFHVNLGQVER